MNDNTLYDAPLQTAMDILATQDPTLTDTDSENPLYDYLLNATGALLAEQECYQTIAEEEKKKEKIKEEHASAKVKLNQTRRLFHVGLLVWSILFGAFSAFMLLMSLMFFFSGDEYMVFMGLVYLIFSFFSAIPAIVFIILFFKKTKKLNERKVLETQKFNEFIEHANSETTESINKIASAQEMAKERHLDSIAMTRKLPPAYSDLFSVSYMLMLVANKRCDTLKEAINMLEVERRHHQLLSALNVVSTKLDYINRALVEVKANLKKTNINLDRLRQIETLEFIES